MKNSVILLLGFAAALPASLPAQVVKDYQLVTEKMLENPAPGDWLMYSRTYDAQRFSPLKQINKSNVNQLRLAWEKGLDAGQTETIPIVHDGVIYVVAPGAGVEAINGATGEIVWEYKRKLAGNGAGQARSKNLAIYQDLVIFEAPDAVVGLDARTGEQRWEAKTGSRGNTSGPFVADGKVITGGACAGKRENCFILANDAMTGKELWRFYTTPGKGEPGDESWGGAAVENRLASTWGLPGTYDPVRKMLYWGVANPMPDQRDVASRWQSRRRLAHRALGSLQQLDHRSRSRHRQARLVLPASAGDDWDSDYTHERTLVHIKLNPDPKFVKWINPDIQARAQSTTSP